MITKEELYSIPEPKFNIGLLTAFSVVVKESQMQRLSPTVHQLFTNLSPQVKTLIISLKDEKMSAKELQTVTNCSLTVHQTPTKGAHLSKRLFIAQYITPAIEAGLLARAYPDTPHHPKQKYFLTELGKEAYIMLNEVE